MLVLHALPAEHVLEQRGGVLIEPLEEIAAQRIVADPQERPMCAEHLLCVMSAPPVGQSVEDSLLQAGRVLEVGPQGAFIDVFLENRLRTLWAEENSWAAFAGFGTDQIETG